MDSVRQYALSLTSAAMLCALVREVTREWKGSRRILELVCGMAMLSAALSPLRGLHAEPPELSIGAYRQTAEQEVREAEQAASNAMAAIIKQQTEAYIMDKATACGACLAAEVLLDENCIPTGARLRGAVSPYTRTRLTNLLERELGIPEEGLEWID